MFVLVYRIANLLDMDTRCSILRTLNSRETDGGFNDLGLGSIAAFEVFTATLKPLNKSLDPCPCCFSEGKKILGPLSVPPPLET